MSELGESPEQPPAESSAEEYQEARKKLEDFAEGDVSHIQTLNELQDHITGLGTALKRVITDNLEIVTSRRGPVEVPVKKFVKEIPERGTISARTNTEAITIIRRGIDTNGPDSYEIDIPLGNSLLSNEDDLPCEAMLPNHEDPSQDRFITPTDDPNDSTTQQEYAAIAKRAVQDVLSVTREPTSMEGIEDP